MTFSWIFEDPRREEDLPTTPYWRGSGPCGTRRELRLRGRLEHPEEELRKLREKRERERQERLEAFGREIAVSDGGDGRPDPFTRA